MGRGGVRAQISDALPYLIVVRQGFAQSLLKRMSHRSNIPGCGITFEIVSNVPGVSTTTVTHQLHACSKKLKQKRIKKCVFNTVLQ